MASTLDTVVIKITGDTKDIDKTIKQLEKVGKVEKQNAATFKKASKEKGKSLDFVKGKALALGATLVGAFAIQQVVGNAINVLKVFEKEMSTLQSITGSTAKEMEFFAKASKEVGKATKTSATEVVRAFTLIGSAQPELLKNSKALAEVTKQALILSKAAGIDATEAAKALTGAMNQFGVQAKDAAKFTDIFATSQQKGSSFIAATSEALKNVGATANAAGISFETTNAAIQALAKGALTGSEAGTALRGVLAKLSSQSDREINPSMVGLGDTIDELESRNLSLADATKLVGLESATGLLTLIKQNKLFKELDGNLNEVGNAMSQMEVNTNNLDGSLEEMTNAWEDLVLSFSNSDGILKTVVDHLTGFFRGLENGNFFVRKLDKSLKDLTDSSAENVDILDSQVKSLGALLKISIQKGKLDQAQVIFQELIARKTQLAIEKRKAEADIIVDGANAQDDANKITDDATKKTKKQLTAIELLNKRIGELKLELQNQALAGDVSTKTVKEYKDAIDQATEAQVNLRLALSDTLPFLDAQAVKMENIRDIEMIPLEEISKMEEFFNKHGDSIDSAIEAEQTLSRVIALNNTNKIIGIDNEEILALKSLDNQGLGEEELAKRRLEIQERSAAERAKILTKQAQADKVSAIFQATINTAMAVTAALTIPPPAGQILAVANAALGAAEIALISSQPIPTFHTGKKAELKEGEMFAKILKSETVIPPEQSRKHKKLLDSVIDNNLEKYVYSEYMLPMIKGMGSKSSEPYNDVHIWNMQKKQAKLMTESNSLQRAMLKAMDSGSNRRSWS